MSKQPNLVYWAKTGEKYYVHPETEARAKKSVELGLKSCWESGLDASRSQFSSSEHKDHQHCLAVTGFKGEITDVMIPATHLSGGVPAKVYKPEGLSEVPVIIIYFHGGGLVLADLKAYEMCLMTVAKYNKAIVVAPEYRWLPCPDDRLAPFNDCEAVTKWVLDNKSTVGGVASSIVGVAGDSAGGQLSCSMTYSIPGRLAFQVLIYPVTDIRLDGFESMTDFWETPGFCGKDMEVMFQWCKLFEDPSYADDPTVNPSAPRKADDPPLSASPPTLVMVVQLDPLRDWGINYAAKLREVGVPVELHVIEGCPHISFSQIEDYPTCSDNEHRIVAEFIARLSTNKP